MEDESLELTVLGPLEVRVEGHPVALGDKARRLLLALVVRRGELVPSGTLADLVWPGDRPADARNALQALVSRLRRSLGPAGSRLVTEPGGYRLDLEPDAVDADRVAAAVETARSITAQDPARAASLLRDVERDWRGHPFVEAADDPEALAMASRLHELRLEAVELHAEAVMAAGGGAELVAALTAKAAEHPVRERLHRVLARALYRSGRQGDALDVLARLERRLRDDLGLDPDPDTTELQRAILQHDPALRDATTRPDQRADGPVRLPPARTSFVGRAAELVEVHTRLTDARLVTLIGPGGTGKTRLAVEAARTWSPGPADGTALVELASLTDPDDVLPAVALALGVPVAVPTAPGGPQRAPVRPLADRLMAHLAHRDLLVVLDNCEHVIDSAATAVEHLLGSGPGIRVLATSREALRVPGEALLAVAPLRLPPVGVSDPAELLRVDAVRLFVDRVNAANAEFELDDTTVPPVVEICRRLDGLPLALELAAARAATVPIALLEERLSDRFRLLTGGRRTVRRQRTLEAVVEWSYDLLDERQRAVLRRLGAFASPPAVEIAEQVCAGSDVAAKDVLPTVAELADKSLLELTKAAGDTRVRLLETIREFAQSRLVAEDDVAAVRSLHATVYANRAAAAATGLRGADQLTWFDRLDYEHDDLRAALDRLEDTDPGRAVVLASDLTWYWWLHDHATEGRRRLEAVVARVGDDGPPGVAVAWAWLSFLRSFERCSTEEITAAVERADAELAARGSELTAGDRATVLLLGGYVRLVGGVDPDLAVAAIDDATVAAVEAGARWLESAARYCKAAAAAFAGERDVALEEARRTLELAEASGDRWARFQTRQLLAVLSAQAGDYDTARADLADAIELADDVGAAEQARAMRVQRATVAMLDGALPQARTELERVLASDRGRSDMTDAAGRHGLGMVARRSGDTDAAVDHHRVAAELWLACGQRVGAAEALAGVAFARAADGDADAARGAVEAAVAVVTDVPLGSTLPLLLEAGAAAAAAGGEPTLALRRLGRAAALRATANAPLVAGERFDIDRIEAEARAVLADDDAADDELTAGRTADGLLPPVA